MMGNNYLHFFFICCRSRTVTPMQIAERVIEIIENMEKQSPKMRAIVQYKTEEILKVCFQ